MSQALLTPRTVTLAALTFAVAAAGCGTGSHERAARTAAPEPALTQRLDGLYTARIAGPRLHEALPGVHLPSGTWALRIDVAGRTLRLSPPEGGDVTLRVADVDARHLRLAPDTACESRAGRTGASRFAWLRVDAFLRLNPLRAPCRSDAALLTMAPWRPAWPSLPFGMSEVEADR